MPDYPKTITSFSDFYGFGASAEGAIGKCKAAILDGKVVIPEGYVVLTNENLRLQKGDMKVEICTYSAATVRFTPLEGKWLQYYTVGQYGIVIRPKGLAFDQRPISDYMFPEDWIAFHREKRTAEHLSQVKPNTYNNRSQRNETD